MYVRITSPRALIYRIRAQHLYDLMRRCPTVAIRAVHLVADELGRAYVQIEELACYDVRDRVCSELLREVRRNGNDLVVDSDRELASAAGTTRESVSRVVEGLERQSAVARDAGGVRVLDPEALVPGRRG